MDFDENKPIYLQIVDNICEQILMGQFKEGERIPSVREWGMTIGVNPNTVARSYELLSNNNIICNQRGIGYSVSDGAIEIIKAEARKRFLEEELPAVLRKAELLGINIKEHIK